MKLHRFILPLALLTLLPLSSCGSTSCVTLSDSNQLLATPITDALAFAQESTYASTKFTANGVGKVTLVSCTDGDTANFREEGYSETIKCRFLGINTPESTAKVEPWGKKASLFTKHVLESATEIVLVNDVAAFGERDSSGNRWLGFIWYKTATTSFRLLNLEIVEQCYSTNQLFIDSSVCNYRSSFEKAEANGKACGYRVYGAKDPDYDYNNTVTEVTLRYIRENYDEVGISDTGSSGKLLRITGLCVGQMGDNFVLRDVSQPYDDGTYASMYAYAGFNSSLGGYIELGDIVKVYCRATKYNDNIQLSDVQNKTTGAYPIKLITPEEAEYANYPTDTSPYAMDSSSFGAYSDFAKYQGLHIKTTITIRNVDSGDTSDEEGTSVESGTYYKKDSSKNMTIYAWSQASGLTLNLRVDGTCYPYPSESLFAVGKSYSVVGYLNAYFDKYQLMLYNNEPGLNYIVPLS